MAENIVAVLFINISYFVVPGAFCVNVLRVYEGSHNRGQLLLVLVVFGHLVLSRYNGWDGAG